MLHKREVRKICAIVALLLVVTLVFVGCATAKDGDNDVYVKFQDRMSMDWGYEDAIYLEKAVMLKGQGKSVYEKADIIIVTLNRVLNEKYPKGWMYGRLFIELIQLVFLLITLVWNGLDHFSR